MNNQSDEGRRLQGCIDDLTDLVGLPVAWAGGDVALVVATLLETLIRILQLDFAHAGVTVADGSKHDLTRMGSKLSRMQAAVIRTALVAWSSRAAAGAASPPHAMSNPLGDGQVSLAQFSLGSDLGRGVVLAGSPRRSFPTRLEALIFHLAVNQAVHELQRMAFAVPFDLAPAIEYEKTALPAQSIYPCEELDSSHQWEGLVGQSAALRRVLDLVRQVAPTDACVLIEGETGTGKELLARAIHRHSVRREQAFVKVNCAAIPTGLLEAELFGHEKGAFTGAVMQRMGRFELADRGTVFLDEIGEIPLELQAKLLRVLQEQEFERLGSPRTIRVDVRLVAASNRHLAQMVRDNAFRSDLYYRVCVFPITMPALRERAVDIPLLVGHFVTHFMRRCKKSISGVPRDTMQALCRRPWPGNVRELANVIERSVIISSGPVLDVASADLQAPRTPGMAAITLADAERDHIVSALCASGWIVGGSAGAAHKLGMKRTSLQYKMKTLGIVRPPVRRQD